MSKSFRVGHFEFKELEFDVSEANFFIWDFDTDKRVRRKLPREVIEAIKTLENYAYKVEGRSS